MSRYPIGDPCSQESRIAWECKAYTGISQSKIRRLRLFLRGEIESQEIPTVRDLSSHAPTLWGLSPVFPTPLCILKDQDQ